MIAFVITSDCPLKSGGTVPVYLHDDESWILSFCGDTSKAKHFDTRGQAQNAIRRLGRKGFYVSKIEVEDAP